MINVLTNLGLNEKEAGAYLACLELGSATIQEIATRAKIKRTSIYNFIDHLIEMGLVSKTEQKKRTYYLAEDPEILKTIQQKHQEELHTTMPALVKLFKLDATKTNFKYFRGKQGSKLIYKDTLKVTNKLLLWTTAYEATINIVGKKFTENYIVEAKKRNIHSRLLRNYYAKNTQYHRFFDPKTLEPMNRKARVLPLGMKLENSMVIYDNKVASFAPIEENYGFVIESRTFANTMRVFYNALWETAKPIE